MQLNNLQKVNFIYLLQKFFFRLFRINLYNGVRDCNPAILTILYGPRSNL